MNLIHPISSKTLELIDISDILFYNKTLELSEESVSKINKCRAYLDNRMLEQDEPIYGINTGFGSLYNVKISKDKLTQLQENLVMSHACGMGDQVPNSIVKLMLLLKIQSLSYGHSGVQLETVLRLMDFFNYDILPVIYTQGSLGASGDLAPLAHLALPLIGKGDVFYEGEIKTAAEVLKQFDWHPITLLSKEGLALLNGTQFMSAYGVHLLLKSYKLSYLADLIGSISLDAFDGRIEPFNELVHLVRPHNGQIKTAKRIREFLDGSHLISQQKHHVQDPYSFRCMPQVHGATKDTLEFIHKTIKTEINSVTDNPNIFIAENEIISGGNFHGQQLATPASVDSIVSSNGQEDHVSMGANSATQAYTLVSNVERILAIELLNASQAIAFRKPTTSSPLIESFLKSYQSEVKFMTQDEILHELIKKSVNFIDNFCIDNDLLFD
jgi:histidine ammonia-lyase